MLNRWKLVAIFRLQWEQLDLAEVGTRLVIAVYYTTVAGAEITYKENISKK